MSLYFWINLLSLSVPFIVSFHPKIQLHRQWQALIPAILISMVPYIVWDVYFTDSGYWGFNDRYLEGFTLIGLPIEEWLFFICIPYACVFTHISILKINPRLSLSKATVDIVTFVLLLTFVLMAVLLWQRAYTLIDMIFAVTILGLVFMTQRTLLKTFYITFLFMLIPFFLVNGILTGTGIDEQVVWYNDDENLGFRLLTIPVEDIAYAFSLILLNLFLFEKLKTITASK